MNIDELVRRLTELEMKHSELKTGYIENIRYYGRRIMQLEFMVEGFEGRTKNFIGLERRYAELEQRYIGDLRTCTSRIVELEIKLRELEVGIKGPSEPD
jgi:hypothetical protein